jgi:protein tyrosine/serine phosphatase
MKKIFSPFSLLIIFIASLAFAADSVRPAEWAVPINLSGVGNLHKINENLYRSEQPTSEGMRNLKKMGIKTIINLRAFHSDKDELSGTDLLNEELNVNTWHIEDEDVIRVLQIIRKKENGPFLIHCQHGADRTGVMSAMYRIVEQGWSKEDALKELTGGGYGFHSIWFNIIDYIKNVDVEKIKREL